MAVATAVFAVLLGASVVLALAAKRGMKADSVSEFFIASRQFGGFLVFFLSAGEIYSIGTIIGFPGGIYAKGGAYGIWFLGYILLAYPIGYFLNPWIWRAARTHAAVTLPDLFKGHFAGQRGGRALELTVTVTAIVFLIPWGQLQFGGLIAALGGLGWHFSPLSLTVSAGVLAFAYVAVSGVRAPAYVSILKDVLLVLAVVAVGVAAARDAGLGPVFHAASTPANSHLSPPELRFAMSTILFQALGFYMFPFSLPNIFTARSEQTVRRTQIFMPLYMLMYPFLVVAAYYALGQHMALGGANQAFMAAAVHLLPGWLLGMVAAGASLSGLIVLAGICLAIGPIVSRNLFAHVPEEKQRGAARLVILLYLGVSIVLTLAAPTLLLTVINTAYFGVTQFLPGVLCILFVRRANPRAIALGIVAADLFCVGAYVLKTPLFGLNIGFIGLLLNIAIIAAGSLRAGGPGAPTPIAARAP